jgi:hypothetical protein
MKSFEEMLGLRLIESLTESPDWESTWWDAVYRGLQGDLSAGRCVEPEHAAEATQRAAASIKLDS